MTRDEFDNLKVGDLVSGKTISGMEFTTGSIIDTREVQSGRVKVRGGNFIGWCHFSDIERVKNTQADDQDRTTTPPPSDHYKRLGLEPWDAMKHWLTPEEYRGYQKGTALAYIARERLKGGDGDIGKAIAHLQKLLDTIEQQDQPEGTL